MRGYLQCRVKHGHGFRTKRLGQECGSFSLLEEYMLGVWRMGVRCAGPALYSVKSVRFQSLGFLFCRMGTESRGLTPN